MKKSSKFQFKKKKSLITVQARKIPNWSEQRNGYWRRDDWSDPTMIWQQMWGKRSNQLTFKRERWEGETSVRKWRKLWTHFPTSRGAMTCGQGHLSPGKSKLEDHRAISAYQKDCPETRSTGESAHTYTKRGYKAIAHLGRVRWLLKLKRQDAHNQ